MLSIIYLLWSPFLDGRLAPYIKNSTLSFHCYIIFFWPSCLFWGGTPEIIFLFGFIFVCVPFNPLAGIFFLIHSVEQNPSWNRLQLRSTTARGDHLVAVFFQPQVRNTSQQKIFYVVSYLKIFFLVSRPLILCN